ncbi:MAG: hypothetical protein ICV80_24730, partial [Microcoleus sp. T1-bin1]|nr:hypothetical protein [Microcoleus sp. T1-bin1]
MNLWKRLLRTRRKLSIITKFTLAFVGLLLLIGIVALSGFVSLNAVQRETKNAIYTGIKMQSLVFEMDAALRNARRLETDFFLLWPTIGFSRASQEYVERHQDEIANVLDISSRLQERIASPNASAVLRQSTPDLKAYREIVEQYSSNFHEAVGFVKDLGIENVGEIAQLEQNSARLSDSFQLVDAPELMVSYLQMQSFEKEYLLTRQLPKMQLVYEAAQRLRNGIRLSSKLNASQRAETLKYLDAYESGAKEIVKLNEEILGKIAKSGEVDAAVDARDPLDLVVQLDGVLLQRRDVRVAVQRVHPSRGVPG